MLIPKKVSGFLKCCTYIKGVWGVLYVNKRQNPNQTFQKKNFDIGALLQKRVMSICLVGKMLL